MHEMGIIKNVAQTVQAYADENGIDHVDAIVLEIGELSLVIPEYIEKLFPIATEKTILEGAQMIIRVVPGMAECNECDEIFNVVEHQGHCPNCGSFEKDILTGTDFIIKEIRVNQSDKSSVCQQSRQGA